MPLKITFEFDHVDRAIAFLEKVGGSRIPSVVSKEMDIPEAAQQDAPAPAEPSSPTEALAAGSAEPQAKKPRKPRNDKGLRREAYGPHQAKTSAKDAGASAPADPVPATAPVQPTAAPVNAASAAAPQAAPASEAPSIQMPDAPAPVAGATKQDMVDALTALYANGKHADKVRDVLARNGATRVGEVKPEKYGQVVADAKAAM